MATQRDYDDIPGTYVFDGRRSQQGYHLNMFCMSLNIESDRERFRANEAAYLDGFADIPPSRIMAFDPATGSTEVVIGNTEKSNGLALDAGGRLYACQDAVRRVGRYEPDDGSCGPTPPAMTSAWSRRKCSSTSAPTGESPA